MASQDLTPEYLGAQNLMLVVTDHSGYDWQQIVSQSD